MGLRDQEDDQYLGMFEGAIVWKAIADIYRFVVA